MAEPEVLISTVFNPWFNLATEDWIFRDMDPDRQILFIWRNSPTVVIGKNQNPWKECNLGKMEKDRVHLARRQSGGGAVFHDMGNTNFTFLSGIDSYSVEKNFRIITDSLLPFGIRGEVSGRNDITVSDKKVSGSAFKLTSDRAFHHGTLLFSSDLKRLSDYLNPSKLKLQAKGISSVKSRVANLSDFSGNINHESFSEVLISVFFENYGEGKITELDFDSIKDIKHLKKYYNQLKSREWLFGKTPDFSVSFETRFDWGGIEIEIKTEKNRISSLKVYSDAMPVDLPDIIEEALNGSDFSKEKIKSRLETAAAKNLFFKNEIKETGDWLIKQF